MKWEEKITEYIDISISLPAIGQGALGIETRKSDPRIKDLVARFNHTETSYAVRAERALLKRLEGGCQVPIAAFGTVKGNEITLSGLVADPQGKEVIKEDDSDLVDNAEVLGKRLAERLLSRGADTILQEVYKSNK